MAAPHAVNWGGGVCVSVNPNLQMLGTKPVPFHKNERIHHAGLATDAHESQWTVAVISWRTFLVHQPALLCAPH